MTETSIPAGGRTQIKARFQTMISDALVRWGANRPSADQEALWIAEKIEDVASPAARIDSRSDDRIVNNIMRHEYRVLSDEEKAQMLVLKDLGLEFVHALHEIGKTPPEGERQGSRELSISATKIEEAVMWAVKHITR